MKKDPLSQFLDLRTTLRRERAVIMRRLERIDSVLNAPPEEVAASAPVPSKPVRKAGRRRKSARKPGQPSLKAAVGEITAAKPLTKAEIVMGLKKMDRKYAKGSLQTVLYAKGNFKRVDGKFAPAS